MPEKNVGSITPFLSIGCSERTREYSIFRSATPHDCRVRAYPPGGDINRFRSADVVLQSNAEHFRGARGTGGGVTFRELAMTRGKIDLRFIRERSLRFKRTSGGPPLAREGNYRNPKLNVRRIHRSFFSLFFPPLSLSLWMLSFRESNFLRRFLQSLLRGFTSRLVALGSRRR